MTRRLQPADLLRSRRLYPAYEDLLLWMIAGLQAGKLAAFEEAREQAEGLWLEGDWTQLGIFHLRSGDWVVRLGHPEVAKSAYRRAATIFERRVGVGARQNEAAAVYGLALLALRPPEARLEALLLLRRAERLLQQEFVRMRWEPGGKCAALQARELARQIGDLAVGLRPRFAQRAPASALPLALSESL